MLNYFGKRKKINFNLQASIRAKEKNQKKNNFYL